MNATPPRARIAWLSQRSKPSPSFQAAFSAAEYDLKRPPRRHSTGQSDLALIDVRRSEAPSSEARELLTLSGLEGGLAGVVILASRSVSEDERRQLVSIGDVCLDPIGPRAVTIRVRDRLRAAAIAEESADRLKSALACELPIEAPVLPTRQKKPRVLFAGAPGPLALKAIGAMDEKADKIAVFNAAQALRAGESVGFDAAVFVPTVREDLLLALARSLRRHRKFSGTPMFALAEDLDVAAAFGLIGIETIQLGHVDQAFADKLSKVAERARFLKGLRVFLAKTTKEACKDTDAATAYYATHSLRQAERAKRTGRPFCLVGISLDGQLGQQSEAETKAAAALIAKICRSEDLTLTISNGILVVMAASTTHRDAMKIAARAAGVLAGRIGEPNHRAAPPPTGFLKTVAAVEWEDGDTPQSLLARLLSQLKNDTKRSQLA